MGLGALTLFIVGVIVWLLWRMLTEMFNGPRN